jgi:hypothetical protein
MVASVALMTLVVLVSGEAPDSSAHTSTSPPATPSETLNEAGIAMVTRLYGAGTSHATL